VHAVCCCKAGLDCGPVYRAAPQFNAKVTRYRGQRKLGAGALGD
jgi:hypothetical protein